MAIVMGVLTAIALVVGMAGNWLFYSRTEGRVLEERVGSMREADKAMADRMNELAGAVQGVQLNNVKLLELSLKADERLHRIENEAANAKRKE